MKSTNAKFSSRASFGVTKKAVLVALGILSLTQIQTTEAMSIKQRLTHNFRENNIEEGDNTLMQLSSRMSHRQSSLNLAQMQVFAEAYAPEDDAAVQAGEAQSMDPSLAGLTPEQAAQVQAEAQA